MKFCARHLTDLTAAIRRKGMIGLCHDDPAIVRHLAKRWLRGASGSKPSVTDFDPRVVAMLEICQKAHDVGLPRLAPACPICGAAKILQDNKVPDAWIDNVSDVLLLIAKVNNLIPTSVEA